MSNNSSVHAGSGGRRAHFGSKGRPLNSTSAHHELLSQNNISISDIYICLGIEPFEIYLTQTDLDPTETGEREDILKFNLKVVFLILKPTIRVGKDPTGAVVCPS